MAASNHLREARVPFAFLLPDLFLGPVVNQIEELQKEDAKIVTLGNGARVNRGDDALQDLGQYLQKVKLRDTVSMKGLQEVESVQCIWG